MTRKNDLTALLPFPEATLPQDARISKRAPRAPRGASRGRKPVQLDQLDLADLVRHHATRRAALRGATGSAPVGRHWEVPPESRWTGSEGAVRQAGEATVEAKPAGSTGDPSVGPCAGAVRRENVDFYLDLLGAVAVMALVLLAAILV